MLYQTLTLRCNNRCVFCAQRGLEHERDAILDTSALPDTQDSTVIAGGEPTLLPELAETIRAAREQGATSVVVQTNGRRLAYKAYVDDLASTGVTHLDISLHGPNPAVHDYHTTVDGSFAQTTAGILNATRRGLNVRVTTVVTRSNFRSLPSIAPLLSRLGVRAWTIAAAEPLGAARDARQRVVPRLGMIAEVVTEAAILADRAGVSVALRAIPACVVGAAPATQLRAGVGHYARPCDSCAARPHCGGLGVDASEADVTDLRTQAAAPRLAVTTTTPSGDLGLIRVG